MYSQVHFEPQENMTITWAIAIECIIQMILYMVIVHQESSNQYKFSEKQNKQKYMIHHSATSSVQSVIT